MRTLSVVFLPPSFDLLLGLGERGEVMLVQALVPQLAVETLDEAVLDRMAGPDEIEPNALRARPLIERQADELGPVVAHDCLRPSAHEQQRVEGFDDARGGQRALHQQERGLPGRII